MKLYTTGNMNVTFNIPQGYEFDRIEPSTPSDGNQLTVILKKKQTKIFDWFVDEYLTPSGVSTCDLITDCIDDAILNRMKNKLKKQEFSLVPWEIKIGLFKFICNDFKYDWFDAFTSIRYINEDSARVIHILPIELIDDLFKTK